MLEDRLVCRMAICKKCRDLVEVTILTPRQGAVALGLVQGRTTKELADELFISEKTVQAHRVAVYEATGTRNPAELCRWAYEKGLMKMLGWEVKDGSPV